MNTSGDSTQAESPRPNGPGKTVRVAATVAATFLRAVVIVTACAVSALWAVTVPILQSPDENLHLDYVFALIHNHGLLTVRDRPIPVDLSRPPATDPQVMYIVASTGFGSMIFRNDV